MAREPEQNLVIIPSTDVAELFKPAGCDPIIDKIRKIVDDFVPDTSTKTGRADIASLGFKIARSKTALDGLGDSLNVTKRAEIKVVNEERQRLCTILDAMKKEARKPLTDWEAEDQKRIALIESKMRELGYTLMSSTATSLEYETAIIAMRARAVTKGEYMEFFDAAVLRKDESLAALRKGKENQVEFEAAQEELRAEAARQEEEAERLATEKRIRAKIQTDLKVYAGADDTIEILSNKLAETRKIIVSEPDYGEFMAEAEQALASSIQSLESYVQILKNRAVNDANEERLAAIETQRIKDRQKQDTAAQSIKTLLEIAKISTTLTSKEIGHKIRGLESRIIDEEYYFERGKEAEDLRVTLLDQLGASLTQKQNAETEEIRLSDLAEKNEREDDFRRRAQTAITSISHRLASAKDRTIEENQDYLRSLQANEVAEDLFWGREEEAEELRLSGIVQLEAIIEQAQAEEKAADDLRIANEAKEAAAKEERLKTDSMRLAGVAAAIDQIIESFPEVTQPEAKEIRSEAILGLEKIREILDGEPHH